MSRKGAVRRWQRRWKDGWVGDMDATGARQAATLDMLIFDHGLVRKAWRNLHEVDAGVWRSNQPDPAMIRRLAARGFRAILNLRGSLQLDERLVRIHPQTTIDRRDVPEVPIGFGGGTRERPQHGAGREVDSVQASAWKRGRLLHRLPSLVDDPLLT